MCDYHKKYDVCSDRMDFFIGTAVTGINMLNAEFSADETRLLLATQEVTTYMSNEDMCIQAFDLKKRTFLDYKRVCKKNEFKGAAISPNGSTIAILTDKKM